MNAQAQDIYVRTKINTANQGELTLMLFNGCLKFMKQAKNNLNNNQFEQKNYNIMRALDIVDELHITLNMDYDISNNLQALYIFIKEKLVEANTKKKFESLDISIELITELRDTWAEILKNVRIGAKG